MSTARSADPKGIPRQIQQQQYRSSSSSMIGFLSCSCPTAAKRNSSRPTLSVLGGCGLGAEVLTSLMLLGSIVGFLLDSLATDSLAADSAALRT